MLAFWYYASVIGVPMVVWFSYCAGEGAPNITVFKVDKFDCVEVAISWKVISSALMGWGGVIMKDDISFDVCW